MLKEKYISKIILFLPILFTIIATLITLYISNIFLNAHFQEDINFAKSSKLELEKEKLKNRVDNFYDYLVYKKTQSERRLKLRLKDRVYMAHKLITKLYLEKKNLLPKEELEKEIIYLLKRLRFGKDGYFFAAHIKSDTEIIPKLLPSTPEDENKNTINFTDSDGKYYIQALKKASISGDNKEGYETYRFARLSKEGKSHAKLSFVKLFEPFNWFIGYGEYIDDFEIQLKEEVKNRLDFYNIDVNNYFWVHNINHVLLYHPYRLEDIGKNEKELIDAKGNKIVQMAIKKALESKEGDYFRYYWYKPFHKKATDKLGYVRYFEEWDWIIGSGVYLEDIDKLVDELKNNKVSNINELLNSFFLIIFIMLIFVVFSAYFISKRVSESFLKYRREIEKSKEVLEEKVEEKTRELKSLNEELEDKIIQRVEEIEKKDKVLAEQSKMVALAEMIGNIAHQWRQPLSTISTAASGLKLKKEINDLSDKELYEFSDEIIKDANYLSQIIEEFNKYIQTEDKKSSFKLSQMISDVMNIFSSTAHEYNIKVFQNLNESIVLNNYENKLTQAIMVVLNNSKDALIETKDNTENRIISITTDIIKEQVVITIEDSGGGIDENIITKVFEPYFTTKDKSQGTGLSLYMIYQFITNNMNGNIFAENTNVIYNDNLYKGMKITISLPIAED